MSKQAFGQTLYESPSDYPGQYVLRGWNPNPADPDGALFSQFAFVCPVDPMHLELIREGLRAHGYICVGREDDDDPVIVETWLCGKTN